MTVRTRTYPAIDTGVFQNPAVRQTKLSLGENTKPLSHDVIDGLRSSLGHKSTDLMAEATLLLQRLDDVAHTLLLQEFRKADPKGHYFFAKGPCKMPDESTIFRGVWKLVRDSSGVMKAESVPISPESHTADDADTVIRATIEQWHRLAVLSQMVSVETAQVVGAALITMYRLGWYMRQVTVRDREPDARLGRVFRDGSKKGQVTAHGSADGKRRRWAEYQREVDRLRRSRRTLSRSRIYELAAQKSGVYPKTIERRTTRW